MIITVNMAKHKMTANFDNRAFGVFKFKLKILLQYQT